MERWQRYKLSLVIKFQHFTLPELEGFLCCGCEVLHSHDLFYIKSYIAQQFRKKAHLRKSKAVALHVSNV